MFTLTCRNTGLDCDFVIKGETMEDFLKSGANHAVEKHGMREEDFYLDGIRRICYVIHLLKKPTTKGRRP